MDLIGPEVRLDSAGVLPSDTAERDQTSFPSLFPPVL